MEQKEMSFTAACKEFFGFKEGQSLQDFMAETKQLTAEDKAEIRLGLIQNGLNVKAL